MHTFPRLKANGPFHELFGWNGVLRIVFFSSELTMNWLFLRKILWNMLCLLCNTTKAADKNKMLLEENKRLVWIFFKTAIFLSFYEQNQTTIVTSFYPKSSWNGPVADSQGKLCLQAMVFQWLGKKIDKKISKGNAFQLAFVTFAKMERKRLKKSLLSRNLRNLKKKQNSWEIWNWKTWKRAWVFLAQKINLNMRDMKLKNAIENWNATQRCTNLDQCMVPVVVICMIFYRVSHIETYFMNWLWQIEICMLEFVWRWF